MTIYVETTEKDFWGQIRTDEELARISSICSKRLAYLLQLVPKWDTERRDERNELVARYNTLQDKEDKVYYYDYPTDKVDEEGKAVTRRRYKRVKNVPLRASLFTVSGWLGVAKNNILIELDVRKK